jgi:flagellar motor switch protein FliN/FliY
MLDENEDLANTNSELPEEDDLSQVASQEVPLEVELPSFDEQEEMSEDEEVSYTADYSDGTEQAYEETVTVQPVKFASFEDAPSNWGESNKNLDILMDIQLPLTVELGRTTLPIKKILELTRGSIVELEKIAGETVELYANGKLIAHGEVVVIEDNFGLRITNITAPEERLKSL